MPNHVTNKLTVTGDANLINAAMLKYGMQLDADGAAYCGGKIGDVVCFDFEKVIPMPGSLDIISGSDTDAGLTCYINAVNPKNPSVYKSKHGDIAKWSDAQFDRLINIISNSQSFGLKLSLGGCKYNLSYNDACTKYCRRNAPADEQMYELLETGSQCTGNLLRHGAVTWYDWRIENWGTKWNAYQVTLPVDIPGGKVFKFATAWSAPNPVIEKLAKVCPKLKFKHEWADENFAYNCGAIQYEKGKQIKIFEPAEGSHDAIVLAARVMDETPEDNGYKLINGQYTYVDEDEEDDDDG